MIAGYEWGGSGVATPGAGAASIELEGNGTRRAKVREIGVFSQSATATRLQIGRPGNTPTGGSVTVGGSQDPSDAAATAGVTTTWTIAPTAPSPGLRQFDFNNVPGSGVVFTWPSDGELVIGTTRASSVVVWAVSASPTLDHYFVWSE